MFKHSAESIKESSRKQFVSQQQKEKYDNYEELFIEKANSYSREEIDTRVDELNSHYRDFSGEKPSVINSKVGTIENLEILGNTIQRTEVINITPEMENGVINNTTGVPEDYVDRVRTKDFIEVNYGDIFSIVNDVNNKNNMANICCYDRNKGFIEKVGFLNTFEIPYNCRFIKYYHMSQYSKSDVIITRTYLDDIKSVGNPITGDKYGLELVSCGTNLIDYNKLANDHCTIEDDFIIFENTNSDIIYSNNVQINTKKGKEYVIQTYDNETINGDYALVVINDNSDITYHKSTSVPYKFIAQTDRDINISITTELGTTIGKHKFKLMIYEYKGSWEKFKPYTESKSNISLPVQLEKVGDVSDRLFKRNDIWYIEKNICKVNLSECDLTVNTEVNEGVMLCYCDGQNIEKIPKFNPDTRVISNTFEEEYNIISPGNGSFMEGVYYNKLRNVLYLSILKSKLQSHVLNSFKGWLRDNNSFIMYATNKPEIIELPLETQIILNSFEGVTTVSSRNTEINPTIKGSIPISLGASANSLKNRIKDIDTRLDKIKNINEGSRLKYESSNGIVRFDSNTGSVNDIKLEGNTLVNLLDNNQQFLTTVHTDNVGKYNSVQKTGYALIDIREPLTGYFIILAGKLKNNLKNNTTYTVYLNRANGIEGLSLCAPDYTKHVSSYVKKVKSNVFIVQTTSDCEEILYNPNNEIYVYSGVTNSVGKKYVKGVVIVEGDHSDKPLSYFSGIKSVGDVREDKCSEIISMKNGINNCDGDNIHYTFKKGEYGDILIPYLPGDNIQMCKILDINNRPIVVNDMAIRLYDQSLNSLINVSNITGNSPSDNDYIPLSGFKNPRFVLSDVGVDYRSVRYLSVFSNNLLTEDIIVNDCIFVDENKSIDLNTKHKDNKKQLLYLDSIDSIYKKPVLRGLPNGTKDTIEKHNDGKWYYHKRCEDITITGKDIISSHPEMSSDTHLCCYTDYIPNLEDKPGFICDKFIHNSKAAGIGETNNIEAFWVGYHINASDPRYIFRFKILKSRLSTPDLQGFKEWMNANNVTIVYQLQKEEVYECTDLNINIYDNETSVIVNAGPIPCSISFNRDTYIGNAVSSLKERVSNLENNIIKQIIFHNRLSLLSRYASDETSLGVDIDTKALDTDIVSIDYKLYDLIYKNILVGKDNYNRVEMEEIIDFYTMTGQLTFEMAGLLFDTIEDQHFDISNVVEEV